MEMADAGMRYIGFLNVFSEVISFGKSIRDLLYNVYKFS